MPLKLVRRKGSEHWYVRGAVRGISVFKSTGVDDKKLAEEIRIRWENEALTASVHGRAAVATFMEAAVLYLEHGGDARFVGRYDEERRKFTGLMGYFGSRKLSSIKQADLDAAAMALYPDATAETRNRQVYTPFIAIWKKAARRELCEYREWERPKMTAKPRDRWARPAEVERMIAVAAPHLGPLVAFLVYTGARMSEALYLDWSDVDLDERWVVFRDTKRKGEDRGIPLHPVAHEALERIRHRKGRVFLTPQGKPYHDTEKLAGGQVKSAWRGMCERAKVAGVTPHTLRHTFSTWLTAAGVSERIRDELMGHASSETGRRYAHVPREELVAAVAKLKPIRALYAHKLLRDPAKRKKIRLVEVGA